MTMQLERGWLAGVSALALALACSSSQDLRDSGSGGSADSNSSSTAASSGAGEVNTGGMNTLGSIPTGGEAGSDNNGGSSVGGAGAGGTAAGGSGGSSGAGATATGGSSSGDGDASAGAGGAFVDDPDQVWPVSLGMNDVTILAPLPASVAEPVLLLGSDEADDGSPLVPQGLVDRLDDDASIPILTPEAYDRLHLVAVRFDLCDHDEPGPCPTSGDASLRLVFQPLNDSFGAEDVGFHAFYSIQEAEIPAALQTLVELSELRTGPAEPLAVSAALTEGNAEYIETLRAFVRAYAGEQRLVRLTMNAQPSIFASITWLFRGLERDGSEFEDMLIEGTSETTQQVMLVSESFFQVTPVSDTPEGLALALDFSGFNAASESERTAALEALVAIDNPLTSAPDRVACVGCHTSTVSLAARSTEMGLDPEALAGRYVTSFDVSIDAGESATLDRTLRALGWLGTVPLISQRVANDTALVLDDLARRAEQPR